MSQDRQIVYPDAEPVTARLLQGSLQSRLDKLGTFTCHLVAPVNDEQFSERIYDADAIILGHWHVSDAVLRGAKKLKIIAYTGIGVASQVNLELANELGIMVCNTPGYANQTVAEHAIALMLAAARQMPVRAVGIMADLVSICMVRHLVWWDWEVSASAPQYWRRRLAWT